MLRKISILMLFLIFLAVPLISSAPPVFESGADIGLVIEPTLKDYIRAGEDHEFEIHVFNATNGHPITSGISCDMHLYFKDGNHHYEGTDSTVSHAFDYAFNLDGGNFTENGMYQAKFSCNDSVIGGGAEIGFGVNNYGEELTDSKSSTFNNAMWMLMILFVIGIFGIFKVEHYIGKFTLYWICHVLFVIGTFSVWQFNAGYSIAYTGLAGIFKVLFYVSIGAMFPMVLLSLAWIFWIHTMTEEMESMMDRGMTSEEAWDRSERSGKGWFKW